jgi:anti-sigma factor RsiW
MDPRPLSREESRWLDGAMSPDERERFERALTADPRRAEQLGAWREAMDLWRDDTRRLASRASPEATADRVLATVASGEGGGALAETAAVRRYATAALVLLGLGVGGTVWTEATGGDEPLRATAPMADERLDLLRSTEIDSLVFGSLGRREGR